MRPLFRNRLDPDIPPALTGLLWPSNTGTDGDTIRFAFTGSNCPAVAPLTLLWRIRPVQQTGYYTTFFWSENSTDFINQVASKPYFGCHPYVDPPATPTATAHKWEIAIEGNDITTDDNGNNTTVVKDGTTYNQSAVATQVGQNLRVVYRWNLTVNTNRVITFQTSTNPFNNTVTSPILTFGDAIWNPGDEMLSGTLRGVQIFQAALTLAQIEALRACETNAEALSVASAQGVSHWYLNMNLTTIDINDKSGNGRNPSWVNSNRPTNVTL